MDDSLLVKPSLLKVFHWTGHDVLQAYAPGQIMVVAHNQTEAEDKIWEKDRDAYRSLKFGVKTYCDCQTRRCSCVDYMAEFEDEEELKKRDIKVTEYSLEEAPAFVSWGSE